VVGVQLLEILDLPLEVFFLMGGTNSCVDDAFLLLFEVVDVRKAFFCVFFTIESDSPWSLTIVDFAVEGPVTETCVGDEILFTDDASWDIHHNLRTKSDTKDFFRVKSVNSDKKGQVVPRYILKSEIC
jgi:hypothetical protein